MILVDTSIWISLLRDKGGNVVFEMIAEVRRLDQEYFRWQ